MSHPLQEFTLPAINILTGGCDTGFSALCSLPQFRGRCPPTPNWTFHNYFSLPKNSSDLQHRPSSWAPPCWGRSWPWSSTRRVLIPQTSTSYTGRTACSEACSVWGVWHWWRSRCRPSAGTQKPVWSNPVICTAKEQLAANTLVSWQEFTGQPYLVLLQATLRHGLVSLLLESDDDQGHEDVDKEEGEDHEVDHIEDRRFHAEAWTWALVLVGGIDWMLQHPGRLQSQTKKGKKNNKIFVSWMLRNIYQKKKYNSRKWMTNVNIKPHSFNRIWLDSLSGTEICIKFNSDPAENYTT